MLLPETIEIQNRLGDYCRSGSLSDIPGINVKNVTHYRRLVFNVIKSNLYLAFPIASDVIGNDVFIKMIDEFFANHHGKTPQIWKLPGEFCEYAHQKLWAKKYGFPWLNDLLHFEWMEIEIHTMPDNTKPHFHAEGDLSGSPVALNPDFKIITLQYPVHLFPVNATADHKGKYFVLMFRHSETGAVRFLNLSVFYSFLIEVINTEKCSVEFAMIKACLKFNIKKTKDILKSVEDFMNVLRHEGFVLGYLI